MQVQVQVQCTARCRRDATPNACAPSKLWRHIYNVTRRRFRENILCRAIFSTVHIFNTLVIFWRTVLVLNTLNTYISQFKHSFSCQAWKKTSSTRHSASWQAWKTTSVHDLPKHSPHGRPGRRSQYLLKHSANGRPGRQPRSMTYLSTRPLGRPGIWPQSMTYQWP